MNVGNRADNHQSDLLELIFRELSVVDRLACDGVNRHWRAVVADRCWSTTKKLDREILLSGATDRQKERFNGVPLIALVRRVHANLVELDLASFEEDGSDNRLADIDAVNFGAMLEGCSSLRSIRIGRSPGTGQALLALAKLPNLAELEFSWRHQDDGLTDAVLMAIAKRGQLKKLEVAVNHLLTDTSIQYLIKNCKSLVTLDLVGAIYISDSSLFAVIKEVHRRHGNPARTLPNGPLDPRIFYFPVKGPEPGFITAESEHAELMGEFSPDDDKKLFGRNAINLDGSIPTHQNPWLVTVFGSDELRNRKLY